MHLEPFHLQAKELSFVLWVNSSFHFPHHLPVLPPQTMRLQPMKSISGRESPLGVGCPGGVHKSWELAQRPLSAQLLPAGWLAAPHTQGRLLFSARTARPHVAKAYQGSGHWVQAWKLQGLANLWK